MATDLILGIVPKVLEYTIAPAKRHLSYAFKCRGKVKELEEKIKELANQQESLQHKVDEESSRGLAIEKYVTDWQSQAEEAIGEADDVVATRDEEAAKRCFFQSCPNLKSRYLLGRKADAATSGIMKLLRVKDEFRSISYRAPLPPVVKQSVEGFQAPSRVTALNEVMKALKNPGVKMVGVYGMGGVGKTTLANELLKKVIQDKSFQPVIMVTVSAKPKVNEIQGQIIDMLGLKFEQETELGRASALHQILMKKMGALVILDDLWERLELEKVGIPYGSHLDGPKIFMTSRNKDVLVDMGSCNNLDLQVLSEEEARNLFEMTVGEVKDVDLEKEIVPKCGGHPLSVVTIAGMLKDKDLSDWEDMLQQLSRFDNNQIEDKVYKVVELSYHSLLDEELKSLFLLCGLLGGSAISTRDLLNYCLGLGLFKHIDKVSDARNQLHKVSKARNRLLKLIGDLKSASLILGYDKEEEQLRMHDVVRDTAALIASKTQYAFTIKDSIKLEEWPSNDLDSKCTRISLPYCDIDKLPQNLECPDIEFFSFTAKQLRSLIVPDTVFERCKKLRVLNFTEINFSSLPATLGSLVNLRTLCLHRCQLSDIAIIGQLKELEVLSFNRSSIEALPCEIGQLTKLKLLDLRECFELKIIAANVLSRLSLLEELYLGLPIEWANEEHENRSNASLSELGHLPHLTALEIYIPSDMRLPEDLMFPNLQRYQIFHGSFQWFGSDFNYFFNSKTVLAKRLNLHRSGDLPCFIKSLLKGTEDLELGYIEGMWNALFYLESQGFQKLRQLRIDQASTLQHIVDSTKFVQIVFPLLESLHISQLDELESICHRQPSPGSFGQLRILSVRSCHKLRYVLSLSLVQSLSKLEELEIKSCENIEAIVIDENDSGASGSEVVKFPQLLRLELSALRKLGGFFGRLKASSESSSSVVPSYLPPLFGETVSFPRLEKLSISSLENTEEIWHRQLFPGSFSQLKSLEVFGCNNLRNVFPAASSERFLFLEDLNVTSCRLLEEIYNFNKGLLIKGTKGTVASQLKGLRLHDLPKLKHIWGDEQPETLTLNYLQHVGVSGCQSLKNLFPSSLAKSLSQLKDIYVSDCGMEEIISGRELTAPCFSFLELTSLTLSRLPRMTTFYPGEHAIESPKLKYLRCEKAILPGTLHAQESPPQWPVFSAKNMLLNLEELIIDGKNLKMIIESPSWKFLAKLESLELRYCRGTVLGVTAIESFRRLSSLETLCVRESSFNRLLSYKMQPDNGEDSLRTTHPPIKSLRLSEIKSMSTSQKDPLLSGLTELDLSWCDDLINLAPSSLASFGNLTSLGSILLPQIDDLSYNCNNPNYGTAGKIGNI